MRQTGAMTSGKPAAGRRIAARRPGGRGAGGGRARRRGALALLAGLLLASEPMPLGAQTLAPLGPDVAAACVAGHDLRPMLAKEGRLQEIEAAAARVPNGAGKLYRIEKAGLKVSYLFGTMHMTHPRVVGLAPAAEKALAETDKVVIETTDILSQPDAAMAVLGRPDLLVLPAGKTIDDYMTKALSAELDEGLTAVGVPRYAIQTLQPWFFSLSLLVPPCESQRAQAGVQVLDVRLALDAQAAGKPVLGLETAIEQLEALASMPLDLQVASLVATLKLRDEMPDIYETMINLYADGRIAMIEPITEGAIPAEEMSAAAAAAYAEFDRRVITQRNHVMAERLRPILDHGGAFVAVGALHLPGSEGVVELLRKDGYRLTRAD